jgi:hypothetical protein
LTLALDQREAQALATWGLQGEQWREWLRRSPFGLDLFTGWHEAGGYRQLLGDDGYRERMVELLSRAVPRDCAAAGFGCTRRIDPACRAPGVCAQDPTGDLVDGARREGPVPGACDAFYAYYGDDLTIWVRFGARDRHRAVFWRYSDQVLLWVDGTPVAPGRWLDPPGYWVDERFFAVDVQGPDDHPAQTYVPGRLVTTIVSVLIHDAELAASRLFVPGPDELWTDPLVVRHGDALHVYPDRAAVDAGRPDRTIGVPDAFRRG